jgi:NitT/TauT family transport system ATP-binding protein
MNSENLKAKNLLHLENVIKRYGGKTVLDDIDLSVAPGEFLTVVGPSGCGKSTLLRIIVGQEQASAGDVYISGAPIDFPNAHRGIVYQKYSLFPHLTVLENVLLGKELGQSYLQRGAARRQFNAEAMHYLERVRLAEHAHKFPHELSGGMQQRVAIAQALIMKPQILLMDEPFGALDPGTREDLQVFVLELWEEDDLTIFFVTHDLEEAVYLGTRIIVLSQYYTDDRPLAAATNRGSRIVADHQLPKTALATRAKTASEFQELITTLRRDGFDPQHLQHIREFNLKHPDSFITL